MILIVVSTKDNQRVSLLSYGFIVEDNPRVIPT